MVSFMQMAWNRSMLRPLLKHPLGRLVLWGAFLFAAVCCVVLLFEREHVLDEDGGGSNSSSSLLCSMPELGRVPGPGGVWGGKSPATNSFYYVATLSALTEERTKHKVGLCQAQGGVVPRLAGRCSGLQTGAMRAGPSAFQHSPRLGWQPASAVSLRCCVVVEQGSVFYFMLTRWACPASS